MHDGRFDAHIPLRLDPRAKLASIAAMAVAVALAPNMLCDFALMGFAFAFGSMLGQLRVSAAMLVLYALFITLAQFVPYLDDVGLRTMFSSFLLLMRKVFKHFSYLEEQHDKDGLIKHRRTVRHKALY